MGITAGFCAYRTMLGVMLISAASGCISASSSRTVWGSNTPSTEIRITKTFSKIKLTTSVDIKIVIGAATSVMVTTDNNIQPIIETTVNDDTLCIAARRPYKSKVGVKVCITIPTLTEVFNNSESGNVCVAGLNAHGFLMCCGGSGVTTLKGRADALHIITGGSGLVRAEALTAGNANVLLAGSGNVRICATNVLEVCVCGSGEVQYVGHPAQIIDQGFETYNGGHPTRIKKHEASSSIKPLAQP
jgi:hypothetical protein